MSTQIQVCVWERCTIIQSRLPTVQRIQKLFGIEGELFEFEWNIFPELTTNFADSRKDSRETKNLKTEWSSCQKNSQGCLSNSEKGQELHNKGFRVDIGLFLGPGEEDKWCGNAHPQTWKEWNVTTTFMVAEPVLWDCRSIHDLRSTTLQVFWTVMTAESLDAELLKDL